jgi:hypothetical protein
VTFPLALRNLTTGYHEPRRRSFARLPHKLHARSQHLAAYFRQKLRKTRTHNMAQYGGYGQNPQYGGGNPQNLQFYSSSFSNQPVSGHSTPFQAGYGAPQTQPYPAQYGTGFAAPGVSGQMGMGASGLRTGWLAAFGTEGYVGDLIIRTVTDDWQIRRRTAPTSAALPHERDRRADNV